MLHKTVLLNFPIGPTVIFYLFLGTETCEVCKEYSKCLNGGFCQEVYNSVGHICLCPTDFSGIKCEKEGISCSENSCGQVKSE